MRRDHLSSLDSGASRPRVWLAAVVASSSILMGCDRLLDVDLPSSLTPADLFRPNQAALIVNSVVASYEFGYSTMEAANAGMESVWHRTSGYYGNFAEYNEIRVGSAFREAAGWYEDMQAARVMAARVYELLNGEWSNEHIHDRERLIMTAATYAGLSVQHMGEVLCEVAFDMGPLQTQREALQRAEDWFTKALEGGRDFETETTSSIRQLAYLGRARVRLALGTRYAHASERGGYLAGAHADALAVQPGFEAWATHDASDPRRWNQFRWQFFDQRYGSIQDKVPDGSDGGWVSFTGYRDLRIDEEGRAVVHREPVTGEGAPDPRVPVYNREITSFDGLSVLWAENKFTSVDDDERMGSWEEAQLILAEIEGGRSAVDRINALRDLWGLPHLTAVDPGEVADAVIEERRRALFLESGNRHYVDKLRYRDTWGWFPVPGTPAVPSSYTYGPATCLLMPLEEYQANPNATGDGTQFLSGYGSQ